MQKKSLSETLKEPRPDPRFMRVVSVFAEKRDVTHGGGKGFGSGALKAGGKIFAMISSKGEFVVKLPKTRVDNLVASGEGEPFDPGHGRLMKEWLVVTGAKTPWNELAREAYQFVRNAKKS